MKTIPSLLGCLAITFVTLVGVLTPDPVRAQGASSAGNGGDFWIGPDFYTIAVRLIQNPEVASYGLQSILDDHLQIKPTNEALSYEGTPVDALSFNAKPHAYTKINSLSWTLLSCERQYEGVLHELFVLKTPQVESPISYTLSVGIIDRMYKANQIDCRGIGESAQRNKLEEIKAWLRSVPALFDSSSNEALDPKVALIEGGQSNFVNNIYDPLQTQLEHTPIAKEMQSCFLNDEILSDPPPLEGFLFQNLPSHNPLFPWSWSARFGGKQNQRLSTLATKIYQYCYRDGNLSRHKARKLDVIEAAKGAWQIDTFYQLTWACAHDLGGRIPLCLGEVYKPLRKLKSEFTHDDWTHFTETLKKASSGACLLDPDQVESGFIERDLIHRPNPEFLEYVASLCES